jgi:hypothetical protein
MDYSQIDNSQMDSNGFLKIVTLENVAVLELAMQEGDVLATTRSR